MSIKTRRFLFYSLVILFLFLGTFLTFNSRGLRIDWKTFQVEATGGIYVSSAPTKTQIKLDGEEVKNETGILQKGTLIDNLLPGRYVIDVNLEGYSPWKKEVEVKSGTVKVFDSIVLIPKIEPLNISNLIARRVVAAGKHFATESNTGVSLDGAQAFGHEIVALSEGGTLVTKSATTNNYYLANTFKPNENLNLTLTFNNLKSEKLNLPGAVSIKKLLPYPYSDQRFVISTNQAIYILGVDRLTIDQVALGANDFFIQGRNGIAWIEDQKIKMFNLPLRSETIALDLSSMDIGGDIEELKNTASGWLVLESNGQLALLTEGAAPTIIDSSVKNFTLSPDEESIVVLRGNNSLFVYNLASGESVDVDKSGSLKDFAWFKDSAHVFLLKGGVLLFADLNSTELENVVVLGENVNGFSYPGQDIVNFINDLGVWERVIID
ncbi:MAG: PEGA domain-containing protein [Candidatus Colwellbacteria bacterium]|nr:PEGA domain-containing protein [Candidatus Colwellbacteria bacterium]